VAYAGELVELGQAQALLRAPHHPYTQGLVRCVPDLSQIGVLRGGIQGTPPMPGNWPVGCRFQPRCPAAMDGCERAQTFVDGGQGESFRCWRAAGAGVLAFAEKAA
jgi:peptide/nickel transport system ATP-binding protein